MTDLELYFKFRCEKGFKKRNLPLNSTYTNRLNYEIDAICKMGFAGYFLIVADVLNWAQKNNVPVGPGRGSAVGSLCSYCLYITHLDPIKYNLIFERFINPGRANSVADIDMDYSDVHRHTVIDYIKEKYGSNKVAHIGTYGSLQAKAAIRDVTRTLGLPYMLGDKLAKLTLEPIAGKPQPLSVCYEKVPQLKNMRFGLPSDSRTILEWADKIENRLRSFGTHAAGIVISRDELYKTVPIYPGKDGAATTQFDMGTVEKVGLIKFDFLGLKALTVIDICINSIYKRHKIKIDTLNLPVDDQQVYKLLQSGDVDGIFQLECSTGIRDLLVQIRPTCLEDICALISIYRPGPLGSKALQHYLKVRAGQADPQYFIPELEPILKSTDGFLIYQEQIIDICKYLAGYSLIEADNFRRIIAKKRLEEMVKEVPKLISGMVANGIKESDAKILVSDMEEFAKYSFCKAHGAAYSYISYQMAYLKTYYPLEFMCSCLISDSNETDKIIKYIAACKEKGIKVLGPSINESEYDFSISKDNKSIRFGLSAIKNLGKPVEQIIQERKRNGPFLDILNFTSRVDLTKINKRKLESLVLAGAFDELTTDNRMALLGAVEDVLRYKNDNKAYESKMETYNKKVIAYEEREKEIQEWDAMTREQQLQAIKAGKKKPGKIKFPKKPELSLLPSIPDAKEMNIYEKLNWEKELLGFFVTGHPLDNIYEKSKYTISRIKEEVFEERIGNRFKTQLVAIPSVINIFTTKKDKKKMANITLEDKTGTIQSVVLPPVFAEFQEIINTQTPALYEVELEITEGDIEKITKLLINKVHELPSFQKFKNRPVELNIPLKDIYKIASAISGMKGDKAKVKLSTTSKSGNVWNLGEFKCNEDRVTIERILKGLI